MQFSCDLDAKRADSDGKPVYLGFVEMQRAQSKLGKSIPRRNLSRDHRIEIFEKS